MDYISLITMPMIKWIGFICMIDKDRSGARDTEGPERTPAEGEVSSTGRLLLGPVFSLIPLIGLVTLQQVVGLDLPGAVVGAVVFLSILLALAVGLLWRAQSGEVAEEIPPIAAGGRRSRAEAAAHAASEAPDDSSVDSLTGLLTFQPFSQRMLEEFYRVKRSGGSAAVVLVDVNHLGQINEQFGTDVGDDVLREVSACLEGSKRVSDVMARMGSDEFGVLLLDCDETGARAFVDRVEQRLARQSLSVEVGDHTTSVWIGICAGIAIGDAEAADPDAVLTEAVDGLNIAKEKRDRRRGQWKAAA